MTVRLDVLQVTRPSARWGVPEALADAGNLVVAVGALLVAIFTIGTPIALAITGVLWVARMARGAF
jgi:hypothetical protein